MPSHDSETVISIRQLITKNSSVKILSEKNQLQKFLIERELGNGHFGITYVATDLQSKNHVALKVELEGSGRTSATVFEQIQNRIGFLPYFPKFRLYGRLSEISSSDGQLNRQPSVRVPTGRASIQISQNEFNRLTSMLPIQLQGLPAEVKLQFLAQTGALPQSRFISEYGQENLSCTVMDFVRGIPLDEKQFSIHMSTFYIWQSAKGLLALHDKGIVHGDIKPENLMIDIGGQIKILDFTTSRILDAPTSTNTPNATSDYSPISHFQGQPPDIYSDVYGLGCVLYRLILGDAPAIRAGNGFEFYSKIFIAPEPWKTLLLRVFKKNIIEIRNPSAKIGIESKISSYIDVEHLGDEINTARQLSAELGKIVVQNESQRRTEWDKLRQDAEKQYLLERNSRWQHILDSVGILSQWDDLFQREKNIQHSTETTFCDEWKEEYKQRQAIEIELGYLGDPANLKKWEQFEYLRHKNWEEQFLSWQQKASEELELKRIEVWNQTHIHEWDSETEHQFNWQNQRVQQVENENKHFQDVRRKQAEYRLEIDKRELWQKEISDLRSRISEFRDEHDKEFSRRRQTLIKMIELRKQEKQHRDKVSKKFGLEEKIFLWDKEWEQREQKSLASIETQQKNDQRILFMLEEKLRDLEQQEIQRQNNRSVGDKFRDKIFTMELGASELIRSGTGHLANVLPTIIVSLLVIICVVGGGYLFWKDMNSPKLDAANQDADMGIMFHSSGEELEKNNDIEKAKQTYAQAMQKYQSAQIGFRRYFEYYPNDTSENALMAHYNLAIIDWNAYLLLKNNQVPDGTLEEKINLLSESEQHLSLYNAANPSEETQKMLLSYSIESLVLTYGQEDPEKAIRSLENLLNRMTQLNIKIGEQDEDFRTTLFGVAYVVCGQKLDELQKERCNTILEQILSQ